MNTFDRLRPPTRSWNIALRIFPHGTHWLHASENLFNTVIATLNEALIDLPLRLHPRLKVTGRKKSKDAVERTLNVFVGKQKRRVPIRIAAKAAYVSDRFVPLDIAEGPMALVNAVLDEIGTFWRSSNQSQAAV